MSGETSPCPNTDQPRKRLKAPSPRQRLMYELWVKQKLPQAEIARELGCVQSTVCRGIARCERFVACCTREEAGKFRPEQQFQLGLHQHELVLEHDRELLERAWERSCQPVKTKKTKVRKIPVPGTEQDPEPKLAVKDVLEETTEREQVGKTAIRRQIEDISREQFSLAMGHCTTGRTTIPLSDRIDVEERQRIKNELAWRDRALSHEQERVRKLLQRAEQAEAELRNLQAELMAARAAAGPACCEETSEKDALKNLSVGDDALSVPHDAMTSESTTCAAMRGPSSPLAQEVKNTHRKPPGRGSQGDDQRPDADLALTVKDTKRLGLSWRMIGRSPVVLVPGMPQRIEQLPFRVEDVKNWGKPYDADCPPINGIPEPPQPGEKEALAVMMEAYGVVKEMCRTNEYDTYYYNALRDMLQMQLTNYYQHGLLPEPEKLPNVEWVRKGGPWMLHSPQPEQGLLLNGKKYPPL